MNLFETLMKIIEVEEHNKKSLIFKYDSLNDTDIYGRSKSYEEIYKLHGKKTPTPKSFNEIIPGLKNIHKFGIQEYCDLKRRISIYNNLLDKYKSIYSYDIKESDDEKIISSFNEIIKYRENLEGILLEYITRFQKLEKNIELLQNNKELNREETYEQNNEAQKMKSDFRLIVYQISKALSKSKEIENQDGY
jgi:hypothetical protein